MSKKEVNEILIRVNYRSGISQEFWVTEFSIKDNTVKWTTGPSSEDGLRPLYLNLDEIESVWRVKTK